MKTDQQQASGHTSNEALASLPPAAGSRRFRSACSGLWYEDPNAAGSIDAVELYGQRIFRTQHEGTMYWVRRVARWADRLHSANTIVSQPGGERKPTATAPDSGAR